MVPGISLLKLVQSDQTFNWKKKCLFGSPLVYGSRVVILFTDLYATGTEVRSIISNSVKMLFGTAGPDDVGY